MLSLCLHWLCTSSIIHFLLSSVFLKKFGNRSLLTQPAWRSKQIVSPNFHFSCFSFFFFFFFLLLAMKNVTQKFNPLFWRITLLRRSLVLVVFSLSRNRSSSVFFSYITLILSFYSPFLRLFYRVNVFLASRARTCPSIFSTSHARQLFTWAIRLKDKSKRKENQKPRTEQHIHDARKEKSIAVK